MTTIETQAGFVIADDLTPYRGNWVAVRRGHIVAAAVDAVELRDDPDVRDDDWLFLVPSTDEESTFLL